ncbi:hypothetical protein ACJIZ3_016590 [Penstemon smallii]|uniref:H15 domain-containing protein n=1 Tax=Penstemon smallii TaxID=265156 RepID=A0ABD3SU69_9LAMI
MATKKKNSTTKTKNSSPHPPYFQMIHEAITTMKDRTGSSQPAIAKYIEENYTKQLPPNFKKILSVQLKRFVKSEKLTKIRNSYKISSVEKTKKPSDPVKEKISQSLMKKASYKATVRKPNLKVAVAMKTVEKAKKTKRLSQIKTPA